MGGILFILAFAVAPAVEAWRNWSVDWFEDMTFVTVDSTGTFVSYVLYGVWPWDGLSGWALTSWANGLLAVVMSVLVLIYVLVGRSGVRLAVFLSSLLYMAVQFALIVEVSPGPDGYDLGLGNALWAAFVAVSLMIMLTANPEPKPTTAAWQAPSGGVPPGPRAMRASPAYSPVAPGPAAMIADAVQPGAVEGVPAMVPGPVPAGFPPAAAGPMPKNNMIAAIFSCILCTPFGIVAVIQSSRVETAWKAGDVLGAQRAASSSRTWTTVAFVLGGLSWLVSIGMWMWALSLESTTS